MKVSDILELWEVVYVDENENILDEAAVKQFKRVKGSNSSIEKRWRCTSGQKKGRLVRNANDCGKRADPKKRRHGKKVMRQKGQTINRKSKITKRSQISQRLTALNASLMSKNVKKKNPSKKN